MTKLIRIYGKEFDEIREFIDSLTYVNKITYDDVYDPISGFPVFKSIQVKVEK